MHRTNHQQSVLVCQTRLECIYHETWLNWVFLKIFGGHESFLWGHWYPYFGLLVTSSLGFKARVGSALFKLSRGVGVRLQIPWDSPLVWHLLTSWQPALQPSHLFHIPVGHWWDSKLGAIMPPPTVWDQAGLTLYRLGYPSSATQLGFSSWTLFCQIRQHCVNYGYKNFKTKYYAQWEYNLWFQIQHYHFWANWAFACKTESLGSLYSHALLILTYQKSSGAWTEVERSPKKHMPDLSRKESVGLGIRCSMPTRVICFC